MKCICDNNQCTGCGACQNICMKEAIQMRYDDEGFLFPHINEEKCVDCGNCSRVCPVFKEYVGSTPVVSYKGSGKGDFLINSTSGGIFPELSKIVIDNGGCVVGAFLNKDLELKHIVIDNIADISKLQGSKYIGSNTSGVFRRVREILSEGRVVLFSGSPCQIVGLKNYLEFFNGGIDLINNLITCDFICHGVGSNTIFRKFIANEEKQRCKKIEEVLFRSKIKGYKNTSMVLVFSDGTKKLYPSYKNAFGYPFSRGMINRRSCSTCRYACLQRASDITLADCITDLTIKEAMKGCSFILANSECGCSLLANAEVNIEKINVDKVLRAQAHLRNPQKQHPIRQNIMGDIDMDYDYLYEKYLKPPKRNVFKSIKERVKYAKSKRH